MGSEPIALKERILFNPTEQVPRDEILKKVPMDLIAPFTRRIAGFEYAAYTGGAKFKNGDTLLARITPCLENGKTAFVDTLEEGEVAFGSTEFIVMRPRDELCDNKFVYYLSISPFLRDIAIKSMVGSSGRQRVQQNVLENTLFVFPDLPTQRAIAATLSSLDDKIELNNRIIANLEAQAQEVLDSVSSIESLPEICLKHIISFVNGYAFKSSSYINEGLYRIITIKNVKDGDISSDNTSCINELPRDMRKDQVLRIGDVLLSLTGNVGRVGIVVDNNLLLNQRVAKIQEKINGTLSFCYFFLRKPGIKTSIENLGKGTAQKNLSTLELSEFKIKGTEEMLVEFSKFADPLYVEITNLKQENRKLSNIRDTLLPKLMSGEIEVPVEG